MPKQKLFYDDSEDEVALKTENDYAKKYDTWRQKEEIHKLEQKYGSKALNSDASISSDSEDDSDEPPEISEEVEEQFLKTLSLLKTKDPRIYDSSYKFFEEKQKEEVKEEKKKTLTFADSDDDDDNDGNIFSIEKKAEILADKQPVKDKSTTSKVGKNAKLKDYLTGKVEHIEAPVERDLAPLKALWSDPTLNEGEAFLRDYILNKRYLDPDAGAEDKLRDDDELEADERTVEEQGKFERAYNFRFEEPDQEYLKRFPRTMSTVRPKDDKRSRHRGEVRARKDEERTRKMEEIARLKALKLKEIQDKIAKIKEVTGNEELAFKDDDIEGDFDPEEHDRRMRAIFDDQYYGDADEEKPVFPDLDKELEIENWDEYEAPAQAGEQPPGADDGPHCEDDTFNMDAEYDPRAARAQLLQQIQSTLGKKRRNRKNKSKLAKLLAQQQDKPKYIPTEVEKTYDEYMEEYYRMDCEDVIGGDLPTRFKYRDVVPNDFGLTVEEILLADDKELTQWVPLKKLVRHRPESAQRSEVAAYRQKAADQALKRRVLPSLYKDLPEEPELVVPREAGAEQKKKKKKKNKNKERVDSTDVVEENVPSHDENNGQIGESVENEEGRKKTKRKNKENKETDISEKNETISNENKEQNTETVQEGRKQKKNKNKKQLVESEQNGISNESPTSNNTEDTAKRKKKQAKTGQDTINLGESASANIETSSIEQNGDIRSKKKKKKNTGFEVENVSNITPSQTSGNLKRKSNDTGSSQVPNKKKKNKNNANSKNMQGKKNKDFKNFKKDKFKNKQDSDKTSDNPLSKLSDERLKAYGLNPKKYRSFLKYKKF